jgi:hypothetical protein
MPLKIRDFGRMIVRKPPAGRRQRVGGLSWRRRPGHSDDKEYGPLHFSPPTGFSRTIRRLPLC